MGRKRGKVSARPESVVPEVRVEVSSAGLSDYALEKLLEIFQDGDGGLDEVLADVVCELIERRKLEGVITIVSTQSTTAPPVLDNYVPA
jgi:hypothetical protein